MYLVVEYVDGVTVENYCRDNRLGIADRVRLLAKVCEAVHYAHRHLVIHCDLKPGNILVNSEGIPKLLDFGTAMLLSAEAGENLTAPRLMTVRYASPEQLRGGRVSTASDIYSLGVILYELLAGVHPFAGPAGSSSLTAALAVLLVSVSLYSARQARDARREAEKANLVSRFLQNVLSYPEPQLDRSSRT